MSFVRDDLDDYKLDTEFYTRPDIVSHISYRADWANGRSRVVVKERWVPQKPPLGAGSFGVVRLERRENPDEGTQYRQRAVKQLRKFDLARMNVDFRKELEALTKFSRSKFLQSQAFVKFLGWFEDDDHIFIAMEYFKHGTLDMFINPALVEQDVQTIALQLLEGLKIMHEEQFTHRDLKPQNIFVVQHSPHWWVKIGDFGISKRVASDGTALRTSTGTPKYLAPEIFHYVPSQDEESDSYTDAVDIWSFACVVYEMLALQVPFMDWPKNLVTFCRGGQFPDSPLKSRASYPGIQFVKSLMVTFPAQRPTARDTLESSWLRPNTLTNNRTSTTQVANETADGGSAGENNVTIKQADATNNFMTAKEIPVQRKSWNRSLRNSPSNLSAQSASASQDESLNVVLPQRSRPSSASSLPLPPQRPKPETESALKPTPAKPYPTEDESPDQTIRYLPPRTPPSVPLVKIELSREAIPTEPHKARSALSAIPAESIQVYLARKAAEQAAAGVDDEKSQHATNRSPKTVTDDKGATTTISLDGTYCDNCDRPIREDYYHCSICSEGDFNLCSACLDVGYHCSVPEHWMVKRQIEDGKLVTSVTETEIAPWTLCLLDGQPDSKLPPTTKSKTLCIVTEDSDEVKQIRIPQPWSPPQRYRPRRDSCFICGQFDADHPPARHISEQHGTGDNNARPGFAILGPPKVWMRQPSEEEETVHEERLTLMEKEMQFVYKTKVKEKEDTIITAETKMYKQHSEMKKELEQQRLDAIAKASKKKQRRNIFSFIKTG